MTPALDLLADGNPIREEVRVLLAGTAISDAFQRRLGPRLGDPEVVRIALEEIGYARCPLPVEAGDLGQLAVSAELVGMGAALLTLTTARVKARHAFGAPLAAMQSVQLRAADMYLDFVAAREAVIEASLSPSPLAMAAAKVTATQSALAIAAGAHQLCGGWGLLDEAGLHHYTRAIKAAESRLGSPREHRRTIADYLIMYTN
ncbi:MAG TPA: acyl-CoA dehydrogenase family protein [Frankiaceae bacterium]|jgi:alkylation response protein AidB-like acyl-CoA dehydrogenase|nr:acyl-CoA dehydrogenase family protein [Frankiaceae bacterium]